MKSQKILKMLFCLALCSLHLLLLSACGEGAKTLSNASGLGAEDIDDGIVNQAAKINCDLYLNASTTPYRKISTISGADTFTENAKETNSVRFDCSGTQDEDSVESLQFAIDTDYQPSAPNFVAVASESFSLDNLRVGRHPMALKVTDSEGKERVKTFTTVVECLDAETPVLNTAGVSITAGSKLNYFTYAINSASVSGGEDFQFAWDFNGDYVIDPVSLDNPNQIWTSSSSLSDIYSIFVTEAGQSRQISVRVKNNCEKESSYTVQAQFPSFNIERTPVALAVEKGFFYLQADVATTSTDIADQRKNGDVLITQYPEDTDLRRIECDYKKTTLAGNAVFSMKANNYYKEGSEFLHGLEIQVRDIQDNGGSALQSITNANLAVAKYRASAADDGIVSELYDRNSQCSVVIRIRRDVPVAPCAAGQTSQAQINAPAVIILGEYTCPNLRDSNTNESVKLDNGKFFCQVAPVDQCVGGGGGGGGTPPPEQ